MEQEFFSVRRDRLLAASNMVSVEQRAVFFAMVFVGSDGLSDEVVIAPSNGDDSDTPTSFPLNVEQARELKSKIDDTTWAVLKAAVSGAKDDVGTIEWSEIKRLTGVSNWAQFAKGRMGGLHRSLRKIAGVPKNAVLLWEGEGWVEDGKGDFSTGTVGIDGPAVHVLRAVCGLRYNKN
jgi:hypothetical protein